MKVRDPVSGGTHLIGALLGAAALVFMAGRSLTHGSWTQVMAFSVFGVSLVLLYSSSAAYHMLGVSERARLIYRRLDHSMIYVLIAGSYTPFCLVALGGTFGWTCFAIVWGLALAGLVAKLFWLHAPRFLSTGLYLLMGWASVFIIVPLWRALGTTGTAWLIAGGLAYSVGAVIYAIKKPDPFPNVFGFHEIWHLFVLAGSACHFISAATLLP